MTTGRAYDQVEYTRLQELYAAMHCHWCGAPPPSMVDHEPPLAEGGSNASTVPACHPCNRRRGGELAQRRAQAAGRGRGYAAPKPTPAAFVATPTTTRWR